MKILLMCSVVVGSLWAMEEVPDYSVPVRQDSLPHIGMVVVNDGALEPVSLETENQIIRSRANTLSSDLEQQIDDLLTMFDDAQRIEDEDYARMIMGILEKRGAQIYKHISPYLTRRLRASENEIRELTQMRKRSNLKKLMKNLMAQSIEEAFEKHKQQYNELDHQAAERIRKHRYALAGTIIGGVATTLGAFLAAYFSACR